MTDIAGYYDTSYPPSLWETVPPPPLATGATAGIPGTFTPGGSRPPATAGELAGIVASPTSLWTVGQYVSLNNPPTNTHYHWNGTAWAIGDAPTE